VEIALLISSRAIVAGSLTTIGVAGIKVEIERYEEFCRWDELLLYNKLMTYVFALVYLPILGVLVISAKNFS